MRTPLLLLVAAIVVGVAAQPAGPAASSRQPAGRSTVLQMNLCLSGLAGCYGRASYPAVVEEAAEEIEGAVPDVVTLNEACRGDASRLAGALGYHLRFAAVRVDGAPLACVGPRGRGTYGLAVLTRDPIRTALNRPLTSVTEPEQRRWLCATTSRGLTACTAHLSTRSSTAERFSNDLECAALRRVLAGLVAQGPTVFAGDVNRRGSCAPTGMEAADDGAALQLPGVQHVYASASLGTPVPEVVTSVHTDHDFLSVALAVR